MATKCAFSGNTQVVLVGTVDVLVAGHVEGAVREVFEAAGNQGVAEPGHVVGDGLGAVELDLEERAQGRVDCQEHVA